MNYTGIFFDDGTHMTWNFGYPLTYPEGVTPGDLCTVSIYGRYEDEDVACFLVDFDGKLNQPSGTLLHITTKVENGSKPVMSGLRATEHYEKIENFSPFTITGVWK
jgi:hypothetical protein